ncbi:hemerythrin domain-containing protein, partial [Streptomyces durbertensis]
MGHGGTVVDELMTDHREVEELFGRIEALPAGDARRKEFVEAVTVELVRHSVAEEAHLYPAVREHVPGGDELADREIEDHGRVERLLKGLEGLDADDPSFDELVGTLTREVREHVADEEQNLFPALRRATGPETLEKLGDKVRRAKKVAPTRPCL